MVIKYIMFIVVFSPGMTDIGNLCIKITIMLNFKYYVLIFHKCSSKQLKNCKLQWKNCDGETGGIVTYC
jgi:hypothetical protein